ncbi:hypothetical protein DFA_09140 [Cavenderia fasciculata]|uniref:Transmembrane protein n=1 Tax=Cavenderia fasciculata TaxID=261658 RepID=F4Q6T3_CACFS|nr:uncharacterized protein DFA_09140 [Cavenderia fasciculata]EGG16593.1 hypothetical protein DFA_09140 [Cavenderia fasciculata]|eukprot:XP_004354993.1 hypothetical protein DFA_09140 [Cavenderia fasciculata]
MKYYHFKIIQIILFIVALYLYTQFSNGDDKSSALVFNRFRPSTATTTTSTSTTTTSTRVEKIFAVDDKATKMWIDESIFIWTTSVILFIVAWNVGGVGKTTSRLFIGVFIYKALIQVIKHLPTEHLQSLRSVIGDDANLYLEWYMGGTPHAFTLQTLSLQAAVIVFFGGILAFNIKLADRFWLVKSILIDWIGVVIALLSTAIYDAVNHNSIFFVVTLAYFFGANILGFGTMKMIEYCWSIRSRKLNVAENLVFDTDETETETNQSTTTTTTTIEKDTTDYSKLSEDELNEILSSPEHLEMERAEDPSKIFINNLRAPVYVRSTIRPKELVITILMMVYALSNQIIQYYQFVSLWQIALLVGLCTTLLAYLTTISSKRLTTKQTSKRES